MDSITMMVSVVPGRIRLRHPTLKQKKVFDALVARLRPLGRLDGNFAVGSLLLTYPAQDTTVVGTVRKAIAEVMGAPVSTPAARGPVVVASKNVAGGKSPVAADDSAAALQARRTARLKRMRQKREINRWAKIGSIASMAVSLAALQSSKKLHAQAGMVFLAMMATHMGVHWRHTIR